MVSHGNQFLPRRVNKSYGFIRARNIMLFKGSFDPVSRLYIRMRLSAVLRSMFKFCCMVLLCILHLSSSKSTSKITMITHIFYTAKISVVFPFRFKHFKCIFQFFPPHTFTVAVYLLSYGNL